MTRPAGTSASTKIDDRATVLQFGALTIGHASRHCHLHEILSAYGATGLRGKSGEQVELLRPQCRTPPTAQRRGPRSDQESIRA
jgi:hypothetical protein